MVTVAKPIAGGLPLGALLVSEKVSQCIHPGMHGTTFGGGPLACAVALQLLNILEKKKLLKHIEKTGSYLLQELRQLQKEHKSIVEVRGLGLMAGMELDSADLAKAVVKQMLECGVILNRTDETVVRFLPPYLITKKHVDVVVRQLSILLAASPAIATANPPAAKVSMKSAAAGITERRS